MTIGIIAEFNPFHNGHLYLINKLKALYPEATIVAIMSGNYTERGEVAIINKGERTKVALNHGIDLVVELPYPFAAQSADLFAYGAISLLNQLQVDYVAFGSESNDLTKLMALANLKVDSLIKTYMDQGFNYPQAYMKALEVKLDPNDTLALCYLKALITTNSKIKPISLKRTNCYHNQETTGKISSAESIRTLLKQGKDVSLYIPSDEDIKTLHFNNDYFALLKYKIISDPDLSKYQTVDEGIENRILKYINSCDNYEDLIKKVKTKRYTYHKLNRMFIHILTSFTKKEASEMKEVHYIKVLGFNHKGQTILKKLKINLNKDDPMFQLEARTSLIYDGSLEYKNKPIIK